ncbi:MAG: S-layer homology domain-containing protein [Actinomycetota bacterium]|nr:S-layer homology domain-containing protein [Actinomycetota bacterium]
MTRSIALAVLATLLLATPAIADPGDVVIEYGNDGFVEIPAPADSFVSPGELLLAPDGTAILDIGEGDIDFGFAAVTVDPSGNWNRLEAPFETCSTLRARMADDGSVFFAGECENGSFLIRYTADLALDKGWGDSATPGVFWHPELGEGTILTIDDDTVLYLTGPHTNRTLVARNLDGTLVGTFPIDPISGPKLAPSPLAVFPGVGSEYLVAGFIDESSFGVISGTLGGSTSLRSTFDLTADRGTADATLLRNGSLLVAYSTTTGTTDTVHLARIGRTGQRDSSLSDPALLSPSEVSAIAVAELRNGDIALLTSDGDLGTRVDRFSADGQHLGVLVDSLDMPAGPSSFWDMAASPFDGNILLSRELRDSDNSVAQIWRFEGDPSGRFADDDGSVFEASIAEAAAGGITKGCNPPRNDFYCPDASVTRGQMAAFLTRALGLPPADPGNSFTDDDTSIFENAIERLATAGITKGCNPPDNTQFCPDAPITRGQMAALLTRALGLPPADPGNSFTDDDTSIFENAIEQLATAGITKGCNPPDNTQFCPDAPVTRGQMAAFLTRALDLGA